MTHDDAFLQAIIESPNEDFPRLQFADWLDERGDPRGEFIRVQMRLAELRDQGCHEGETCNVTGACSECGRDVEAEPLRRRERELLDAHRSDWFRLLSRRPGFGENNPLRWWPVASNDEELADRGANVPILSAAIEGTPRRGFVERVGLTAADWLAHADALTAAAPIREVALTTWPEVSCYVTFAKFPQRKMRPVDVGENLTADEMMAKLFEHVWPRIQFTLPAASQREPA